MEPVPRAAWPSAFLAAPVGFTRAAGLVAATFVAGARFAGLVAATLVGPARFAGLVAATFVPGARFAGLVAATLVPGARFADLVAATFVALALAVPGVTEVDLAELDLLAVFGAVTFVALAFVVAFRATALAGAAFFDGTLLLAAEVAFFTAMLGPLQDGISSSPQNTYWCA